MRSKAMIRVIYVHPSEDVLRELGRVMVSHGHLEEARRIVFKRMLKTSVLDDAYDPTRRLRMRDLRDQVLKKAAEVLAGQPNALREFTAAVTESITLSDNRNLYAHGLWAREGAAEPLIYDNKKVPHSLPTVEQLLQLDQGLRSTTETVTRLTKPFLEWKPAS